MPREILASPRSKLATVLLLIEPALYRITVSERVKITIHPKTGMHWSQILSSVAQIWEERPDIIALLVLGLAMFAYIVLDTRKCRHRPKDKHQRKY